MHSAGKKKIIKDNYFFKIRFS